MRRRETGEEMHKHEKKESWNWKWNACSPFSVKCAAERMLESTWWNEPNKPSNATRSHCFSARKIHFSPTSLAALATLVALLLYMIVLIIHSHQSEICYRRGIGEREKKAVHFAKLFSHYSERGLITQWAQSSWRVCVLVKILFHMRKAWFEQYL